MSQQIKALRFDSEDIGKHVAASKKRFTWIFSLKNKNHTIVIDFSFISGKVKLVVDRKILLQSQIPTNVSFQHPFTLQGYALNVLQQGQTFELRINNKVFSHLYNQSKNITEFKNYEDQVKDIEIDEGSFQAKVGKKMTLNIGGMGTKKKNYKSTTQSQNWGNFGGNNNQFNNYFGESGTNSSGTVKKQQKIAKKAKDLLDDDQEQKQQTKPQKKNDDIDFFSGQDKPQVKKTQQTDFFADSNPTQQVSSSPSQEHLKNLLKNQKNSDGDFNTMQDLFSTMNVQNQPIAKTNNDVDLFGQQPSYIQNKAQISQKPQIQTPDINDFNTMQQLFTTNNIQPPQSPNDNLWSLLAQNQQQNNNYQQPQQNNNYQQQYQQQQQQQQQYQPPGQFNTMTYNNNSNADSNMFSTSVPKTTPSPFDLLDSHIDKFKSSVNKQNKPQQQSKSPTATNKIQNINMEDFNTMQDLFKSQTPVPNLNYSNSPTKNQSKDNFNTTQNLSQTTNQPTSPTINNNKSSASPSRNDFNTMQNLSNTQTTSKNATFDFEQPQVQQTNAPSGFGKKKQVFQEDLI